MLSRSLALLVFCCSAWALPAAAAAAAAAVPLAAYRAVEDLSLDPALDSRDVASVRARLVTEFTGSDCAGFTTNSRMVIEIVNSDGGRKVNDWRTVTVETPAGGFDFDNLSYADGRIDQASKGSAERAGGAITVTLSKPDSKTVSFDAALLFPTEQITRILAAARAGQHFVNFTGYDGLDDGQSPVPTSVVIGAASTDPADIGDDVSIARAGFASMLHWPLTISYFSDNATTDQTPDFSISGVVYNNGVMRETQANYGKFSLASKLAELDMLPAKPCP